MISPKEALVLILEAAPYTSVSISTWLSRFFLTLCSRWTMDSTMITAPSTINPKSIAPKLIRFPLTPNSRIMEMANKSASGITEATIIPARQFPNNSTNTKTTINAPSIRFVLIVLTVWSISLVLSIKGSIATPSGNDFLICSMRSFTSRTTSWVFPSFNIITIPPTSSPLPSLVTAP